MDHNTIAPVVNVHVDTTLIFIVLVFIANYLGHIADALRDIAQKLR